MNESKALAIVYGNTRHKRRTTDLLTVAESIAYLVGLYGSRRKVSARVGLSSEMIGEFLRLLSLPDEVKDKFIRPRRIDKLYNALNIARLSDPAQQVAAAEVLAGSVHATEPRTDFSADVKKLAKRTHAPVRELAELVRRAEPQGVHFIVVDLDDGQYSELRVLAKKAAKPPAVLAKDLLVKSLRGKR